MTAVLTAPAPAPAPAPAEKVTIKINNVCGCGWCPSCEVHVWDECECGADVEPFDCGGECYRDAVAWLDESVAEWAKVNGPDDGDYLIEGRGMGWRNLTGTKIVPHATGLSEQVAVDDSWEQVWTVHPIRGGALTCTQYHHDSPTGETYTVTAL